MLGGIIIEKHYAGGELTRQLDDFKQRLFGTTEIVLHTADITRNRRRIVQQKFKRGKEGQIEGYGLVIMPK